MFAGQRLTIALGSVNGETLREDDDASRKQIIRAAETMVDAVWPSWSTGPAPRSRCARSPRAM